MSQEVVIVLVYRSVIAKTTKSKFALYVCDGKASEFTVR